MADTTQNNTSKKPTQIAYHVRNKVGGDGFWNRIGAAWSHEDGQGYNIHLDTFPIDGRITLRNASETPAS